MAYWSPPDVTTSAGMMASVSGILIRSDVPSPHSELKSTVPPICSMLVRTTSMPTPRPDRFDTCSAVEKPGANTSSRASHLDRRSARSAGITPFATALALTFSGSIPPPSSEISRLTCPDSWKARSVSRPARGLPRATRVSGSSIP
jgi:hypothetical protein